jgi:alginate O-acetyltransferase complex protein AlgI
MHLGVLRLFWFRRSVRRCRLFRPLGLGSVFINARAFPELAGRLHWINAGFLPPGCFIAHPVHQPMMDSTERDREFIAYLARMFGIILPLNFFSPYRATNIIEFWRRWHITLSRFLRDFVYIPFGGNKRGPARRYVNLMGTMLIGGLWHGAGWTFVFWGGLHGLYLCVNHLWRAAPLPLCLRVLPLPVRALAGWVITFGAVIVAWVFFRAPDFLSAFAVLRNMFYGPLVPVGFTPQSSTNSIFVIAAVTALIMPNAYQWLRNYNPAVHFEYRASETFGFLRFLQWQPSFSALLLILVMGCWAVSNLDQNREFIYFRF